MRIFDKDFEDIFLTQISSITGGLIAGTILAIYTDNILVIPGMFMLIPGFLEMKNAISGSLAARISSGLHLGVVKIGQKNLKLVKGNALAAFLLAMINALFLGLLVFAFNLFLFKVYLPKIILVPLIAAVMACTIEIPVTILLTLYIFDKGHDPDYIMGPFITSLGDILSVIALLLAVMII
jgi:mgtE-like transporter